MIEDIGWVWGRGAWMNNGSEYHYKWKLLPPLKFICWNLTPNVMVFGGGAFGRWLDHEVFRISVLIKRAGGSDGEVSVYNARPGFYPWVGTIPWRRKRQPTPVLLPRKSHGWRSLVQATVHGVAKSWARLNDFTWLVIHWLLLLSCYYKEMSSGENWQVYKQKLMEIKRVKTFA